MLRDILSRKDPQAEAALRLITGIRADVILLTGFDYDHQLIAAQAFADRLAEEGLVYPHLFALRPNRGMATGLDLDRDNRRGGPGDAQGWGWFSGQNGMLLLSQLPIRRDAVQDYSAFLWADLPGADLPPDMTRAEKELQRLSASGHWQVPLLLPSGETLTLLAWHATPPVFDGPEDRNGRRNHDEAAFWLALLAGTLPFPAPEGDFILLGTSNLDPQDGEGRPAAMRRLLQHALLQDPQPRAGWFTADPAHRGDPALDTAVFAQTGGLRLSVILPSAGIKVAASAVLRADPESRTGADLTLASPHFPLWADLTLAPPPAP